MHAAGHLSGMARRLKRVAPVGFRHSSRRVEPDGSAIATERVTFSMLHLGDQLSAHPAALTAVFAGGVLTSLTPCLYPMIPITVP